MGPQKGNTRVKFQQKVGKRGDKTSGKDSLPTQTGIAAAQLRGRSPVKTRARSRSGSAGATRSVLPRPGGSTEPEGESAYERIFNKMMKNRAKRGDTSSPFVTPECQGESAIPGPADSQNELGVLPPDHDGVVVTVHAPEGEFCDSDDDSRSPEDFEQSQQGDEQQDAPESNVVNEVMRIDITTDLTEAEKRRIRSDPAFQQLLRQLVEEEPEDPPQSRQGRLAAQGTTSQATNNNASYQPNYSKNNFKSSLPGQAVRSPSESTVYAPMLNKTQRDINTDDAMVSNFVEGICLETARKRSRTPTPSPQSTPKRVCTDRFATKRRDIQIQGGARRDPPLPVAPRTPRPLPAPAPVAKDLAIKTIVDSEKYKAYLAAPKGNLLCNSDLEAQIQLM